MSFQLKSDKRISIIIFNFLYLVWFMSCKKLCTEKEKTITLSNNKSQLLSKRSCVLRVTLEEVKLTFVHKETDNDGLDLKERR